MYTHVDDLRKLKEPETSSTVAQRVIEDTKLFKIIGPDRARKLYNDDSIL